MSLSELVQSDARAIPALDGDSVTLTAPATLDSTVYVVPCITVRAGKRVEAEGFAVVGAHAELTVSLAELAAHGLTDPETLKARGWTATMGGVVYLFDEPAIDYTIGEASVTLKRSA